MTFGRGLINRIVFEIAHHGEGGAGVVHGLGDLERLAYAGTAINEVAEEDEATAGAAETVCSGMGGLVFAGDAGLGFGDKGCEGSAPGDDWPLIAVGEEGEGFLGFGEGLGRDLRIGAIEQIIEAVGQFGDAHAPVGRGEGGVVGVFTGRLG